LAITTRRSAPKNAQIIDEYRGHSMKNAIKRVLRPFLEVIFGAEAALAARWAFGAHRRHMRAQWYLGPSPEFFDHYQDLFYLWVATRNSLWVERGAFGGLALKGGNVLELACGDGFNAKNFYSLRSRNIVACDFDPRAIALAKRKNAAPNVTHVLADIRQAMPGGCFENIIWDGAIAHFTPDEIAEIMSGIKSRLTTDGILSGSSLVEPEDGSRQYHHHEYEFHGMEDLARFLRPHFKNVKVFETIYPARRNLYFWASDGVLPFDPDWTAQIH
jgi:SAM-dependent methyltransferase